MRELSVEFLHLRSVLKDLIFLMVFEGAIHLRSGHGAVRLAHLVWDQGVAGSNPAAPTRKQGPESNLWTFLFHCVYRNETTCGVAELDVRVESCCLDRINPLLQIVERVFSF